MTDTITLTGLVATEPKHITTSEGLTITSFRLASSQRRYDRNSQSWVDGDTNWYTVTAFRRLASNSAASLLKGQRVLITGRLRLREWQSGERSGLAVEVEADAIGHDLSWGTAQFSRNSVVAAAPEAQAPSAGQHDSSAPDDGWASPGGSVAHSDSSAGNESGDGATGVPSGRVLEESGTPF